jgi:ornithine cyclodeaminase/alanine dehydrogenase-like protein (mu-crystallin family)
VRILDAAAVDTLLDDSQVLDVIRDLFTKPTGSDQIGYGRIDLGHPHGWIRSLPAYIVGDDLLGFKVLHRTEGVGMRYTIYVHRLSSGEPIGIVDGLDVTNIRTGAVSAVATNLLAQPKVEVAAIVGTGPVARGQLRALELVRPASEVRVFARTAENRSAFVRDMADFVTGTLVESSSLDEALDEASLVTLATKATEPVLEERHLRAGSHFNSVGPASRDRVEVDPAAFTRFDRVVCDSVALVFDEAGDAVQAASLHGFDADSAEELSDLVSGTASGRPFPEDITLFKSVGTGAQDLAVAARLLALADDQGLGVEVADVNSIKPSV